jgi:hypothetical protein
MRPLQVFDEPVYVVLLYAHVIARALRVATGVRAIRVEDVAELSGQDSLQPHSIKIDRSLILGLLDTDEGTAIIEAIPARPRLYWKTRASSAIAGFHKQGARIAPTEQVDEGYGQLVEAGASIDPDAQFASIGPGAQAVDRVGKPAGEVAD